MSSWTDQLYGRPGIEGAIRWAGATLAVTVVYAGGLVWALSDPAAPVSEGSPPTAIMMEFAPQAEAVSTDGTQLAPDMTTSDEVQSDVLEPVKEPSLDPRAAEEIEPLTPEKPQEMAEAAPLEPREVDPVETSATPRQENVAVPLPPAETERPIEEIEEKPEAEKKPQPVRKPPPPASKRTNQAAAPVRKSDRNAASQTSSGRNVAASTSRWQSRLLAHLERYKRYPRNARSRGVTGIAYVRFQIDHNGRLLSANIVRSSRSSELDSAALAMVRNASPMPAPPPGAATRITVPVRFIVR